MINPVGKDFQGIPVRIKTKPAAFKEYFSWLAADIINSVEVRKYFGAQSNLRTTSQN